MKHSELHEGDVLTWTPADRHCREGQAIVVNLRGGLLGAYDTYWVGEKRHWLDTELATATVQFNLNDYTQTTNREEWLRHLPADRAMITHQHGSITELYLRNGAQPDLNTEIANAVDAVRQASLDVTAAQSRLRRAEARLADLQSQLAVGA